MTPNNDFIDYRDFSTVAGVWTYMPKVPEQRWYYMKDALGSVMGLVGSHPNAQSEFHLYDVYGKPNGTSDVGNPYMFTSRRVDVLDGGNLVNQHSRHRDLDYNLGRFKTHDPLGLLIKPVDSIRGESTIEQLENLIKSIDTGQYKSGVLDAFGPIAQYDDGLNLNQYVHSKPLTMLDPDGRISVAEERAFKHLGYLAWREYMVKAPHWRGIMPRVLIM